jgi:hypothetical protein
MSLHGLARGCLGLFAVSTAFPITAGFPAPDRVSRWLGVADVIVAAALSVTTMLLGTRARRSVMDRHRLAAFHVSQGILSVILVLLVAYFVLGNRLNWPILVIGLAWRAWLLLYTLPFLVAVLQTRHD